MTTLDPEKTMMWLNPASRMARVVSALKFAFIPYVMPKTTVAACGSRSVRKSDVNSCETFMLELYTILNLVKKSLFDNAFFHKVVHRCVGSSCHDSLGCDLTDSGQAHYRLFGAVV